MSIIKHLKKHSVLLGRAGVWIMSTGVVLSLVAVTTPAFLLVSQVVMVAGRVLQAVAALLKGTDEK